MAKEKKKVKENGEESGNRAAIVSVVFVILTVIIWLVVFCALVKLDIGGFGSNVMRPVFRNVPVINLILPKATDEEIAEEFNYPYKNYQEAVAYIQALEMELQNYQAIQNTDADLIEEYEKEIARLKIFEQNQTAFEQEKERYYEEVVFGNGQQATTQFQEWFENMDKETAEKVYQALLEKQQQEQLDADYVASFESMKPAQAAAIFAEMTGDLDTVVKILRGLDSDVRSDILSAMAKTDAVLAAKITLLLAP